MGNRDTIAAWRYHDGTKHSEESVRRSHHVLDWANQPIPYKIYETLEPIPLSRDLPPLPLPALEAIGGDVPPRAGASADLATVARLCL